MALLYSTSSIEEKLQGLLKHVLAASRDESLKTALTDFLLQTNNSDTNSGSKGSKFKKKKIPELLSFPPPIDGESLTKEIRNNVATHHSFSNKWYYTQQHTVEWCYSLIRS